MAYEKMDREYPCPCGKGKMIAEWQEHDVYPSGNRLVRWRFECTECSDNYVFRDRYIVQKSGVKTRLPFV